MGRNEIRIAGFGGQGVLLSGKIIGQAASIHDKGFANLTQSYGPESRGGSCTAEMVISDKPIDYPYVTNPQVLILLSQEAYNKYGHSQGTLIIIDKDLVKPNSVHNSPPLSIPATRMAREMGNVVVANIIILGFLAAVSDLVSYEALRKSILTSVPKEMAEFNIKAFETGYNYGMEQKRQDEGTHD